MDNTKTAIEPGTLDIDTLMVKSIEVLRRDITHLMMESLAGKLSYSSGRDLVAYIKLLREILDAQSDLMREMSDEEIKTILSGTEDKQIESRPKAIRKRTLKEDELEHKPTV